MARPLQPADAMRRMNLALALALVTTTACAGSLSTNQKQGLAVVGGVSAVMGGTLLIDGWSCDQANWNGSDCTHDGGELRNGTIMLVGGGALLTWALIMLSGDDVPPEAISGRTARTTASK